MAKKATLQEVKEYIKTNSDCKLLSTEYKNAKEKLQIQCECGEEFERSYSNIKKKGCKCDKCLKKINEVEEEKIEDNIEETEVKLTTHQIAEIKNINDVVNVFLESQINYIPPGINAINVPYVWRKGYSGKNVKIAVLDTGCCTTHPDLKGNIIGGRNFTNEDNGNVNIYEDYNGHGTHICGTIAGNGRILGVAPNASLLILKVLDKRGAGNLQGLINAINYAISQKVDIISMSLGCSVDIAEFHTVIKKAVNNNILVVCASGNSGDNNANTMEIDYPAGYNEVISVGATDNTRLSATFTNSNKEVDLVAPGVNVLSTFLDNKYRSLNGTSMAVPHVTGALALLIEWTTKEFGRKLSEVELYGQLIKNTIDLNIPRTIQGNGLIFFK